jgi:hypothetical protein
VHDALRDLLKHSLSWVRAWVGQALAYAAERRARWACHHKIYSAPALDIHVKQVAVRPEVECRDLLPMKLPEGWGEVHVDVVCVRDLVALPTGLL